MFGDCWHVVECLGFIVARAREGMFPKTRLLLFFDLSATHRHWDLVKPLIGLCDLWFCGCSRGIDMLTVGDSKSDAMISMG